jgi:hypothetical protein
MSDRIACVDIGSTWTRAARDRLSTDPRQRPVRAPQVGGQAADQPGPVAGHVAVGQQALQEPGAGRVPGRWDSAEAQGPEASRANVAVSSAAMSTVG